MDDGYEVRCSDTVHAVSRDLSSCSCCLNVNIGVPCSHIFAALAFTSDSLFRPDLIADRWSFIFTCIFSLDYGIPIVCKGGLVSEWLACWTQAQKARVQIAAATLSGNSLRQTVHTHRASVHQAAKLVAALLRVARVTAGLAESNVSLPPGL